MIKIIVLVSFFIQVVHAECAKSLRSLKHLSAPARTSGFFFKILPGTSKVFFHSPDDKKIFIQDLATNEARGVAEGNDMVPSPDGKFLTLVAAGSDKVHFLSKDFKKFYSDPELQGKYQSVGKLSGEENTYRVLTDQDGMTYQDYEISNFDGLPKAVPKNETPVKVCANKNYANQLQLPMLSKSGKLLGAFDTIKRKTIIFEIGPKGECTEKKAFKFMTGKVDFSFNDDKIVFHASSNQGTELESLMDNVIYGQAVYKANPDNKSALSVFEYDFKNENYKLIAQGSKRTNYYYPIYTPQDEIIFLTQVGNSSSSQQFFQWVDAEKAIKAQDFQGTQVCSEGKLSLEEEILSVLLAKMCDLPDPNRTILPLISLGIDQDLCDQFKKNKEGTLLKQAKEDLIYWITAKSANFSYTDSYSRKANERRPELLSSTAQKEVKKVLDLTTDDILKACYKKLSPIEINNKEVRRLTVPQSCLNCHMGSTQLFNPDEVWGAKIIDRMTRTDASRMPRPPAKITQEEKYYLEQVKQKFHTPSGR